MDNISNRDSHLDLEKSSTLDGNNATNSIPENEIKSAINKSQVKDQSISDLVNCLSSVDVKLADKQADVNSPLYSVHSFEELGLDEKLLKGIYSMKFSKPSKVQERALPLLISDPPMNMIAQSQSGTGKTAAFVLTMLKRVEPSDHHVQAICLVPTRELARQILDVVHQMGKYTDCTMAIVAREETQTQESIKAHIVVGTPGTILALENKRLLDLSKIKIFILDEADVMLDKQGMGMQSMRIRSLCAPDSQLLLFSATFSDSVIDFAHRIIPNANVITLKREELSVEGISQYYMECESYEHKIELLSSLYGIMTIGQSIIFLATRNSADDVFKAMEKDGHKCSLIHGGMAPSERDTVIDEFRQGKTKVLLATNVLARGIDIQQVSLVINFDLPMTSEHQPDPETYLHRIGRTGRFGRKGVAINFIHNRTSLKVMTAIQNFYGREIIKIPTDSLENLENKLSNIKLSK